MTNKYNFCYYGWVIFKTIKRNIQYKLHNQGQQIMLFVQVYLSFISKFLLFFLLSGYTLAIKKNLLDTGATETMWKNILFMKLKLNESSVNYGWEVLSTLDSVWNMKHFCSIPFGKYNSKMKLHKKYINFCLNRI